MNASSSSAPSLFCSGQEDVWFQTLEWLTPIEWCHLQATSRIHLQLLRTWFQRCDDVLRNEHGRGMSTASTAKERVCRNFQARQLLLARKSAVEKKPPSRRRQNSLGEEYFVEITRIPSNGTNNDSGSSSNVWSGFIPAIGTSLRMSAIQDAIAQARAAASAKETNQSSSSDVVDLAKRNSTKNHDHHHWKEWIDLLEYANVVDNEFSSPGAHREWEQKARALCRKYRFSIVQVMTSMATKNTCKMMEVIMFQQPLKDAHVDNREYHPPTDLHYFDLMTQAVREVNQQRRERGAPPLPPSLHVWVELSPHRPSRFTELRILQ